MIPTCRSRLESCDEIVISDAISRRVNLEMAPLAYNVSTVLLQGYLLILLDISTEMLYSPLSAYK